MNSGFGQQKWENLRRGISHFSYNSSSSCRTASFSRLKFSTARRHWCTHPEAPEFHRFLYLFFPALRFWLLDFFQFVFQFSPAGLFFLLLLPGKLAVGRSYLLWLRCSGFSRIGRGRRIFLRQFLFFLQIIVVVTDVIHNQPDGSGPESV